MNGFPMDHNCWLAWQEIKFATQAWRKWHPKSVVDWKYSRRKSSTQWTTTNIHTFLTFVSKKKSLEQHKIHRSFMFGIISVPSVCIHNMNFIWTDRVLTDFRYHFWRGKTIKKSESHSNTRTAYEVIAEKNCPNVFYASGDYL